MAGDWLKVEKATARKPEILRMSVILNISPDQVFGMCFRFWSWCDEQVIDGTLPGMTPDLIDMTIGFPGFTKAMISVGWVIDDRTDLYVPNFDRHLSQCAKRRASNQRSQAVSRAKPARQQKR